MHLQVGNQGKSMVVVTGNDKIFPFNVHRTFRIDKEKKNELINPLLVHNTLQRGTRGNL